MGTSVDERLKMNSLSYDSTLLEFFMNNMFHEIFAVIFSWDATRKNLSIPGVIHFQKAKLLP